MSDQKISGLTAATTLAETDIMYVLKDPSGTPLDRKITIGDFAAALTTNYITPASASADVGTLASGHTVTRVQTKDGTSYQVTETTGSPCLTVRFVFTGVAAFFGCVVFGRYDGSGSHVLKLQIYNSTGAAWETIDRIEAQTTNQWYTYPLWNSSAYINSGQVELLFFHEGSGNATHNLYIDYVALIGW